MAMSEEAKGSNGQILGTEDYFKKLNQAHKMSELMEDAEKYNYYESLKNVSGKIQNCLDNISSDLDSNAGMLRFISDSARTKTKNFIESLEGICKIIGSCPSEASECINFLDLTDSKTSLKTNVSTSELDRAYKIVSNGGEVPISSYERKNVLKEAAKDGINWAVGSDARKRAYIDEILHGNKEDFLIDVWNMLCYYDNGAKGKCGYEICSDSYLQYHEKEALGSGFNRYDRSGYDDDITESLKKIVSDIEKDVKSAGSANNYMKTKNAVNLRAAIDDLDKCKISVPSGINDEIFSLDWYVGGKEDKIKKIQQGLNGYFGTKRLLEDGVYGEKTKDALRNFAARANDDIVAFFENAKAVETTVKMLQDKNYYDQPDIEDQVAALRMIIVSGRKALQYAMWDVGIQMLKGMGYTVSAECLKNSISNTCNMYFSDHGNDSIGIIEAIKKSKEFNDAVSGFMTGEDRKEAETSGRTCGIDLEFKDTKDLYYSLGKVHFEAEIRKSDNQENLWEMSCHINDTYDFSDFRTYRIVVENDEVKGKFNLSVGNIANDLGLLSQIDEVINNYTIQIDFNVTIVYDGEKYAIS